MPLESSEFPEEVQVAFFIYSLFADRWEGMNGTYLGKDWTNVKYYFKVYKVQDPAVIIYFMHIYDELIIQSRMTEAENRRKQQERKAKTGGGKNFAHKIQG